MMNDGMLEIYRKVQTKSDGGKPIEVIEPYTKAFYGELSFTAVEYYEAKQAETEIAKKVCIHQDKTICNKHVIIVDGTQYDVGRTFSTVKKGIAITEITLERVTAAYDIA